MTYNGYHGREYMNALIKSNVRFDVISINQDSKCNEIEDMRTNYMQNIYWCKYGKSANFVHFKK